MSRRDLDRKASELELEKLAAVDPVALELALARARSLTQSLPKDFHWTEEPALTFCCTTRRIPKP